MNGSDIDGTGASVTQSRAVARHAVTVTGIVQGVGFRPFVHGVAARLGLSGFVRNRTGGALIEVEGLPETLDQFLASIASSPPPARIDEVRTVGIPPRGGDAFRIEASGPGGEDAVLVPADVATCDECLRELFDPTDRRYRYAFITCARCGPRLTIVTGMPFDRHRTTMAAFPLCAACRKEHDDPGDRRFHAQSIACPACGPRLRALASDGRSVGGHDPLADAVRAIRAGGIVAVKGLGGYHLACAAADPTAVDALRRRKHREAKPFAVMVADLAAAEPLALVSPEERSVLASSARPVVLMRRRRGAPVADGVAPESAVLGLMLPYAPLHHLLLRDLGGMPVVMTSGNRTDEPIACDDAEARERLASVADLFLTHDRAIHARADDSVVRVVAAAPLPIRRSRGYAPEPLVLPRPLARPTLAAGGHLKATIALGNGRRAFVSPHLGDLDDYEAYQAYTAAIEHYERLFRIRPEQIVHDLHPDYGSTRYARARGLEPIAVQHHHAHLASCLADNGVETPVIGVCFDGAGFGLDGAVWGGEFLVGDAASVERAAHLRYVGMPGGERAIREPWRMAVAHLVHAGVDPRESPLARRIPPDTLRSIERMLERGLNAPPTSSVGRLFDAVASLAAGCDRASFEGHAAMRLEALATGMEIDGAYPLALDDGPALVIDPAPLVRAVARDVRRGVDSRVIARRFHTTIVDLVVAACRRLRVRSGLDGVALTGGVFVNAIVTTETCDRLAADGFRAYRHRRIPPNDGGLCLGQLAIVAAREAAG